MSKPGRNWWSEAEDNVLEREVRRQGDDTTQTNYWSSIAAKLPGRTNKDCRKRWSKVNEATTKGSWDGEEDEMLRKAVEKHGFRWAEVARKVDGRSADQCSKRWLHFLNPELDRGEWTSEDDERLLCAVNENGRDWKGIVESEFPSRSPTDVRNRFLKVHSRRSWPNESRPMSWLSSMTTPTDAQFEAWAASLSDVRPPKRTQDDSCMNQSNQYTAYGNRITFANSPLPLRSNSAADPAPPLPGQGNHGVLQFHPHVHPPEWNWNLNSEQSLASHATGLDLGLDSQHFVRDASAMTNPYPGNQVFCAGYGSDVSTTWHSPGDHIPSHGTITELSQLPKSSQEQIGWLDALAYSNSSAPAVCPPVLGDASYTDTSPKPASSASTIATTTDNNGRGDLAYVPFGPSNPDDHLPWCQ